MRITSFRPVALGAALAATALISACSSQNPGGPVSTMTTSPGNSDQQVRTAAAKQNLKFAGKTLTVELTGYDSAVDMVKFKQVKHIPGGEDNGHYEVLPEDPGTHRLPLAKSARILSVISICSNELTADSLGRANKPCTKEQLVQKLNESVTPFAQLTVDADDNITLVSELYAP